MASYPPTQAAIPLWEGNTVMHFWHSIEQGRVALLLEPKPAAGQALYPQELPGTGWGRRNTG